jgi:hypothetical protein
MAAPRVLSGVLLELVTAWQGQANARPISPVADAVWEEAKRDIARHDREFEAAHPEPGFPDAA